MVRSVTGQKVKAVEAEQMSLPVSEAAKKLFVQASSGFTEAKKNIAGLSQKFGVNKMFAPTAKDALPDRVALAATALMTAFAGGGVQAACGALALIIKSVEK